MCDHLTGIVATLGLYSTGRASLFLDKGDSLVLVGRYSPMTNYCRSIGRDRYPSGQGTLGTAWQLGSGADPDLPNPGPINDPPNKGWLQRQQRAGLTEAEATALHMRSRSYAAIRLDHQGSRLGVLVVECTNPADETAACPKADNHPGGSLAALMALSSTDDVIGLSRCLHHLRRLAADEIRSRVVEILPIR